MLVYLFLAVLGVLAIVFSKYKAEDYKSKFYNSGYDIGHILKYSLRD